MKDRKRFQNQTLDREDYGKYEDGAEVVKNGGVILAGLVVAVGALTKYGPELLKNFSKLRKI